MNYKLLFLFVSVLGLALFSCKKDASTVQINLNQADTGRVVNAVVGQTLSVTVGNPGDGGFTYNAWQYDTGVLQLSSHTFIAPANPNLIGNFGADNWKFKVIHSGTTDLKLTATQSYTVTLFNDIIKAN